MQDVGFVAGVSLSTTPLLLVSAVLAQADAPVHSVPGDVNAAIVERFTQSCVTSTSLRQDPHRLQELGWRSAANETWPLYAVMRRVIASTIDKPARAPADAFAVFASDVGEHPLRLIFVTVGEGPVSATQCIVEVTGIDAATLAGAMRTRLGIPPMPSADNDGQIPSCKNPEWVWSGNLEDDRIIRVDLFPGVAAMRTCLADASGPPTEEIDGYEGLPEAAFVSMSTAILPKH